MSDTSRTGEPDGTYTDEEYSEGSGTVEHGSTSEESGSYTDSDLSETNDSLDGSASDDAHRVHHEHSEHSTDGHVDGVRDEVTTD